MSKNQLQIYTVSQINSLIRVAIEETLPPRFIVSGEISNWKVHQSGHCYFSLKDADSQLPCVMWKSKFKDVKFEVENGLAVLAKGYVDVYPPQGKYQFYVEKLDPSGVGALQLAFEQMVAKLKTKGLFEEEHKKTLPRFPQRIAILTSSSGAAIGDITDSITNRWPAVDLLLYPVPVQGKGASEKIAAAIKHINANNKKYNIDLMIVGRGGGSLEDLWVFNEEPLAYAIFDSKIPVISAVGHEYDTTIADLVADTRASTPTKAALIAVPDKTEILTQLIQSERRLTAQINSIIELNYANLETIQAANFFRNPAYMVELCSSKIQQLFESITYCLKDKITEAKSELSNINATLKALDPKKVLERGYSITTNKTTGKLITKPADVNTHDKILTELADEKTIESTAN